MKIAMNLNRALTLLAIFGGLCGVYMLIKEQRSAPTPHPINSPAVPPFKSFIFGAGFIEAASENIDLGTMVGGVIQEVFVKKGDEVIKDQPLFTLDSRQAVASLQTKEALLKTSQTALEQAKASLQSTKNQLDLINKVDNREAITKEELITRQDKVLIAQKNVENAQASVESAEAQINEAQTILNFYTVKAPMDCEILQINVHPGEYAATNRAPLMLIGSVGRYHIRVNVDEDDAWRFHQNEPAIAFLRGNVQYHTDLKFEYIEPYVVPKRSLTGDSIERVDTRVLQVIYSYDPKDMPAYLGQEVDVYIKSPPVSPDTRYGGPSVVIQ